MLSDRFQEDMPLNMFVFPASSTAALPDVFVAHTVVPSDPETVDPAAIEANRERWIDEWTDVVLRDPGGAPWAAILGWTAAAAALLALGIVMTRRRR